MYLSVVDCYKAVCGLNGLNFNDYFEYCSIKNTRANHPYITSDRLQKDSQKNRPIWQESRGLTSLKDNRSITVDFGGMFSANFARNRLILRWFHECGANSVEIHSFNAYLSYLFVWLTRQGPQNHYNLEDKCQIRLL